MRSGDIVFARIGATTGKSYLITNPPHSVFASYRVRCEEGMDPGFLSKFFQSDAYWRQVDSQKDTNLKKGVNGSILKTLRVPVPPLPEQRKIAGVLGLVQRAMEQQERLIEKTAELKKTLLHQLFTQGTRGEPQKQTDIGPVPESWDLMKLGDLLQIKHGYAFAGEFFKESESLHPLHTRPFPRSRWFPRPRRKDQVRRRFPSWLLAEQTAANTPPWPPCSAPCCTS